MSLLKKWPHTWFGYFGDSDTMMYMPQLEEVVDPAWKPYDFDRLIVYLRRCPILVSTFCDPITECPVCHESILYNPCVHRSDGLWVWPDNLWHFVLGHHVRLPDSMLERIRSRKYVIPRQLDVNPIDLEWPSPDNDQISALRKR